MVYSVRVPPLSSLLPTIVNRTNRLAIAHPGLVSFRDTVDTHLTPSATTPHPFTSTSTSTSSALANVASSPAASSSSSYCSSTTSIATAFREKLLTSYDANQFQGGVTRWMEARRKELEGVSQVSSNLSSSSSRLSSLVSRCCNSKHP